MAEIKKYLDLESLGTLVDQIKAEDAKVLKGAKDYADGLAGNYDAAGSAATAESNAKAYTDELANGQVKTNKEAIEVLNGSGEGSVAKAIADAKLLIDADIDAVEGIANKNKDDIAAINNSESGILAQAKSYADGKVAVVQGEVDSLESYVGTFTPAEGVDTVVKYIDAKTANIASDATVSALADRVTQAETDIDNIEKDYLKAADKTELEGKITAVETAVATEKSRAEGIESGLATRIKAVEDDYLKAADKTELEGKITAEENRAKGIESGLESRLATVEGDYLKASDKEDLQTQINTIMNNPDAEGAINSINEFTQYVKDHGTIADGFRTDIDKNKEDIAANAKAIADQALSDAATYATKTELANEKKALQEEIDADVKVVADDLAELEGVVTGLGNTKADKTALDSAVEALEGADSALSGRIATLEGKFGGAEGSVEDLIADAKQEAIDTAAGDASSKAGQALIDAKAYTDTEVAKDRARLDAIEKIEHHSHSNKSELDLIASGDKAKWDEAYGKRHEHSNKSVLDGITSDLITKWNTVDSKAAQTALDGAVQRIAANEGAISTLNGTVADKADTSALNAAIERIAKNETDIANNASAINSFTAITAAEVTALFA